MLQLKSRQQRCCCSLKINCLRQFANDGDVQIATTATTTAAAAAATLAVAAAAMAAAPSSHKNWHFVAKINMTSVRESSIAFWLRLRPLARCAIKAATAAATSTTATSTTATCTTKATTA